MSYTSKLHKRSAPKNLGIAVLTISTSKYRETLEKAEAKDVSGDIIENLVAKSGHSVVKRELLPDDLKEIRKRVEEILREKEVDVLVSTGGTGISKLDVTVEAVEKILDKRLPGFGELFRHLSYKSMGSAAIVSRAMAGVRRGKAVFMLPGSPDAVETAVKELIIPELTHIIKHAREG